MTKVQFENIVKHIIENQGGKMRFRLNLVNGSWFQGKVEMLDTRTILVTQENNQPAYVDVDSVISITAG